jgi:hypothetical protein
VQQRLLARPLRFVRATAPQGRGGRFPRRVDDAAGL